MKPKHIYGEWATLSHPVFGTYTGHIRKRRGRWWFCGDACRDVRVLLDGSEHSGWRLDKHKIDSA